MARWVQQGTRDRAQTIVNAGTGLGVLVSGPITLVLLEDWRWAWGAFAVIAAFVTGWVALTVPPGRADHLCAKPDLAVGAEHIDPHIGDRRGARW